MMNTIRKSCTLIPLWMLLMLTASQVLSAEGKSVDASLILIHLDAVSTHYLLQELEAGNLPNIESYFGENSRIDNTITYFPSKTPTIISSIRLGKSVREADLPGWKWLMDATDQTVNTTGTFLRMVFSKSRVSRSTILYGIPSMHWVAGPALVNVANYVYDYPVIEFYWYNIDTQGHFHGEEAYLEEMQRFDRQFGKLIQRLPEDINLIIYSDHGMAFGDGIEIDDQVKDLLGDELKIYSFPTLFLYDETKTDEVAQKLVDQTPIDYTFFESDPDQVTGIHEEGRVTIRQDPATLKIQYSYETTDIFGYFELGYNGEFLSEYEWLELTHDSDYPMAPVLLFEHLKNDVSGDILTLFSSGKYQKTGYGSAGNHGGFTREELRVPLLLKGEGVHSLAEQEYYHLPNLFQDLDEIGFNSHPPRERHSFSTRTDFRRMEQVAGLTLSPSYRIRYGAFFYDLNLNELNQTGRMDLFGMGDLFRSYLNRFWFGAGISFEGEDHRAFLLLQHDLQIRRLGIQNSYATHRPFEFRVHYQYNRWLAIQSVNFTSLGVRLDF